MGFVEDAESIKAKAHVTGVPKPALVGIAIGVLVIVALVASSLASALGLLSATGFSIEKTEQEAGGQYAESIETTDGFDAVEAASSAIAVVHVTGAVGAPGVYELSEGDRVQDAIDAAGGFVDGADPSAVNCARVVQDGEQIYVPLVDAEPASEAPSVGSEAGAAGAADASGGKVNINRADASELDTLPGVGPSTAEKIIADREANGPFASIEDIKRVSGIGDKKYEQLAGLICV